LRDQKPAAVIAPNEPPRLKKTKITPATEEEEKESNKISTESSAVGSEPDLELGEVHDALLDSKRSLVDEDSTFVELPTPGLHISDNKNLLLRLVPNICTICLCNYEVGSDVVWSSNLACEHAFHLACIEPWLMKQREGPLCPCCRRDFIVDPYDMEEESAGDVAVLNTTHYQGV
jgi:hypothetical protein